MDTTTTCATYSESGAGLCAGVVQYPRVWTNETLTQAVLAGTADAALTQLAGLAGSECKQYAARFLCGQYLGRCDELTVPAGGGTMTVAIPEPVSYDVCSGFVRFCSGVLQAGGMAVPDCDAVTASGVYAGLPTYPSTETVTLESFNHEVDVNQMDDPDMTFDPRLTSEAAFDTTMKCSAPRVDGLMCEGVVTYDKVWENATLTQEYFGAYTNGTLKALSEYGGTKCMQAAAKFFCGAAFQRCDDETVVIPPGALGNGLPVNAFPVALPNFVERSTCEAFKFACKEILALSGGEPLDCAELNQDGTFQGYAKYPSESPMQVDFSDTILRDLLPAGQYDMDVNAMTDEDISFPNLEYSSSDVTMKCVPSTEAGSGYCSSVVDYTFWTNDTITPQYALQTSNSLLALVMIGPLQCKRAALKFLCAQIYMPCDDSQVFVPVNGQVVPVPLPTFPHHDLCSPYSAQCTEFLETFRERANLPSSVFPNCDAIIPTGTFAGLPSFPRNDTLRIELFTQTYTMQPNKLDSARANAVVASLEETECPVPLIKLDEDPDEPAGFPCALPCPIPIFSDSEYDGAFITLVITSLLSLLGSIFVVVTFLVFSKKRAYPGSLIVQFSVTSMMTSLGFFIGGAVGPRNIICHDDHTPATFDDAACAIQGIWITFWALATAFWYLAICFNLYSAVVREKRDTAHYNKYFHSIIWPLVSVLTIVPTANQKFGNAKSGWCFINEDDNYFWQFMFFYTWIGLNMVLGVYMISHIIIKILRVMFKRSTSARLRAQRRPVAFAMLIVFIFFSLFAYRLNQTLEAEKIETSLAAFISCRISAKIAGIPNEDDGCVFDHAPSYFLYIWITIAAGTQGLLVSLFYGATADNFWSWAALCGVETEKGSSKRAQKFKQSKHMSRTASSKSLREENKTEEKELRAHGESAEDSAAAPNQA